ncbi:hypothetical protein Q8A67_002106 [Cirrhinus molitorella]|uniref:Uncharacterized protein n=1 Tax=Cirrhinus molitorella TaxID=172907 RepID=A0AA88Q5C8_9TELE|nr:hypothetical protein Q8A67_002106 [Cirrhinus molitorella]
MIFVDEIKQKQPIRCLKQHSNQSFRSTNTQNTHALDKEDRKATYTQEGTEQDCQTTPEETSKGQTNSPRR